MAMNSLLIRICLGCALSASLLTGAPAAAERVLDLVAEPPRWGPPGGGMRGKGGGSWHLEPSVKPTLPFVVKLESIQLDASDPTRFIVEFTIRNLGKQSFALPVGRDERLIDPSRRGKRQLLIILQERNKPRENRTHPSATFSNSEEPSSSASMAAGELWRVRFPIRLSELEALKKSEQAETVDLQAGLKLWEYEDDPSGLVLKEPLPDAISENSLSVPLKAP